MNKEHIRAELSQLPDVRAPLPMAYGDPAFKRCLTEAIETPQLVEQFDRLYGANLRLNGTPLARAIDLATGRHDADMHAFIAFVHDVVYLRLPSEALHALRISGAQEGREG